MRVPAAKEIAAVEESTQPDIEVVDDFNVWKLDSYGNRDVLICGAQRIGHRKGLVCIKGAGDGTVHFGYGRCSQHELTKEARERFYKALLLSGSSVPNNPLQPYIDRAYDLSQSIDLRTPQPELAAMMALFEMRKDVLASDLAGSDVSARLRATGILWDDLSRLARLKLEIVRTQSTQNYVTRDQVDALVEEMIRSVERRIPGPARVVVLNDMKSRLELWQNGLSFRVPIQESGGEVG